MLNNITSKLFGDSHKDRHSKESNVSVHHETPVHLLPEEQLFADPSIVSRSMVEDLLKSKRIDGVDAALAAIAGCQFADGAQTLDLAARADDLDVPVQIIWGSDDAIIPVSQADNLAGASVHRIDGAGHMPMMEKAAEVNDLIAGFVARA